MNAPKDIVHPDSKKKSFSGSLVICPTPVGNIRDVSLRVLEALDKADIIACEDTRVAGKLFKLLKEKRIREEFEELQEGNDPPEVFEDQKLFGEGEEAKHPNMFQIRREKQKMREYYQKKEYEKALENSRNIIQDLDSFRGYFKKDSEETGEEFFDSKAQRPRDKSVYGLDDPYIEYLQDKVRESKLQKGRGLFMSVHKFNEEGRVEKLVQAMEAGFLVVLVSDAGTPTISDPGSLLVDTCLRRGLRVDSLPGPNVVSVALAASGFPSDRFVFGGYLSKTASEREEDLKRHHSSGRTTVLFENKTRLMNLLRSVENVYGSRQLVYIGMELTKMFERSVRGEVGEVYERFNNEKDKREALRGEVTVVIGPCSHTWNKDLLTENVEQAQRKGEEGELGRDVGFEESKFQIEPRALVYLLRDRLDVDDASLSELVADILNVPKSKVRKLINEEKPKRHVLYKAGIKDKFM